MTRKEHNAAVKLIRSMFGRMERIFESDMDWDKYIEILKGEQRQHKRMGRDFGRNWLGDMDTVRLFAVLNIIGRQGFAPHAKAYFHIKGSVFGGYALATTAMEALDKAFSTADREAFLALDYAELNKEPS